MSILRRNIEIAFALSSPEDVISNLKKRQGLYCEYEPWYVDAVQMSEEYYKKISRKMGKNYSLDEIRNMYYDMKETCGSLQGISSGLFQLLVLYANKVLTLDNCMPVCKRGRIMGFRSISLKLGQDIFTSSYLAYNTIIHNIPLQKTFDWPALLETDDSRLKYILNKGIAENHFHLTGSTRLFPLSWIALMNHPERIGKYFGKFKEYDNPFLENRNPIISFSNDEKTMSWAECLRCASWIRAFLFKIIIGQTVNPSDFYNKDLEFADTTALNNTVLMLRLEYGKKIKQPDGNDKCLDYAIRKDDLLFNPKSNNRLLYGERFLMYYCFLSCFNGSFGRELKTLFYTYLLLKARFRSELVQVNREVGFANFSIYQDRKGTFWDKISEYWVEAQRLAVNSTFDCKKITSLEIRMTPEPRAKIDYKNIKNEDELILFADSEKRFWQEKVSLSNLSETEKAKIGKFLPFFYVFHFIKRPLIAPQKPLLFERAHPRNYEVREKAKKCAISLSVALEKSDYLRSRIRGIDAASSEIGCRPEIFATAFRYLKSFVPRNKTDGNLFFSNTCIMPKLCITYHAGEDFLDISDGLRAIDESIDFLNLSRGDRIGHALALGIDAKTHYQLKCQQIVLPKQDMLDNLVWILKRSLELGVTIESNLNADLKIRAEQLLYEIYGECITRHGLRVTLDDYYNSWKIRGDNPECYIGLEYKAPKDTRKRFTVQGASFEQYKNYYVNNVEYDIYRMNKNISCLLHYYHYGYIERKIGLEVCTMSLEEDYIELMSKLQDKMQEIISQKGISIECNLSSNHLIGTFERYDEHPIFRFNKYIITPNIDGNNISVSLNTDDQGVFDTSLENEYSLLVECMSNMRDEKNKRLYSDDTIYKYLDHIRTMGISQTFQLPF